MLRSILSITPSWLGGTGFHNLSVLPWKIGHYRLASLLFIARGKEQGGRNRQEIRVSPVHPDFVSRSSITRKYSSISRGV